MTLAFSAAAFRQLSRLEKNIQKRIVEKLNSFCAQEEPLQFAEKLTDARFAEWRFRVGDYRALFDVEGERITILAIGHRREIYR